jgi:hypothetical protein
VPYLAIRIYLYVVLVQPHNFQVEVNAPSSDNDTELINIVSGQSQPIDYDISLFVIKNIIMIYIALKEVRFGYFVTVHLSIRAVSASPKMSLLTHFVCHINMLSLLKRIQNNTTFPRSTPEFNIVVKNLYCVMEALGMASN